MAYHRGGMCSGKGTLLRALQALFFPPVSSYKPFSAYAALVPTMVFLQPRSGAKKQPRSGSFSHEKDGGGLSYPQNLVVFPYVSYVSSCF
jgi:hypothetical protein